MPYSRLLKKIVAESGYTCKEIVEKCKENGKKLDRAYFSKLMNDKLPPPSEELSETIAKVCNADERILVLEGYLDKAPEEIRQLISNFKFMGMLATTKVMKNNPPLDFFEIMRKEVEKESMAEFVLQVVRGFNQSLSLDLLGTEIVKFTDNVLTLTLNEPVAIPVKDNSMQPVIPQNSKVTLKLKEEYNNGDLLVIKAKDKEEMLIRYVLFSGDKLILTAINKEYPKLEYKMEDVQIMGVVAQVLTEF